MWFVAQKLGPFSHFDIFWKQTDTQTNQAYKYIFKNFEFMMKNNILLGADKTNKRNKKSCESNFPARVKYEKYSSLEDLDICFTHYSVDYLLLFLQKWDQIMFSQINICCYLVQVVFQHNKTYVRCFKGVRSIILNKKDMLD